MELQTTGMQRDMVYPVRAEGDYAVPTNGWPRDPEKEEREMLQVCRRENLMSIEDKVTVGTSMASPLLQLLQRRTSRVNK